VDSRDLFPVPPSPFTWSLFQEGWRLGRGGVAEDLAVETPEAVWVLRDGRVESAPGWGEGLARALYHASPLAARLLGGARIVPRSRGWRRFLSRPRDPWDGVRERSQRTVQRLRRWARDVEGLSWTQADVLQVMEEIGPHMGMGVCAWTEVTVALADALAASTEEAVPRALSQVREVRGLVRALDEAARSSGDGAAEVIRVYPWLAPLPLEAASPRWAEIPDILARRLSAIPAGGGTTPAGDRSPLSEWLERRERLRSALAQVVSAARTWVRVVAREAMEDGRFRSPEEAFFLTLEELKQVVTGEWSRPERVRPLVDERRRQGPEPSVWWETWPELREDGVVVAEGWHPGWVPAALGRSGLATRAHSPVSYGHVLAAVLGIRVEALA